MEDRIIKPGLYAYQFRVDISNSELTKVMQFMQKYDVKHYIVGAETSTLGKEHFQCIFWFSEKINTTKLRNWWKGKTSNTKQPVSLTSAKKIRNLAKYTKKDKNFITNLTKEDIVKIGEWSPKVKAADWTQLLDEHAAKYVEKNEEVEAALFDEDNYYRIAKIRVQHFVCYMLQLYRKHSKRPHRATLQYLAWKHGHMEDSQLASAWF